MLRRLMVASAGCLAATWCLEAVARQDTRAAGPLAELLARAGDYQASYAEAVSGVTLEERYDLVPESPGVTQPPVRFASDLVLVNLNGRIISLRDPFAVDSVPLRERTPRITALLAEPTADDWERAQAYATEQNFRFISDLILALNDPAIALQFAARDQQPRLTFKLERQETLNGAPVARVAFKENGDRRRRFMLETPGNAAAAGRLWIETATGAIIKSELWATSPTESVVSTVSYARNATLTLWLPQKMTQTFQWEEAGDLLGNRTARAYQGRLYYRAEASYNNVRRTPVDLAKMRR